MNTLTYPLNQTKRALGFNITFMYQINNLNLIFKMIFSNEGKNYNSTIILHYLQM
jgi:hypothetical protein